MNYRTKCGNFQFQEDLFVKNEESIGKIYQEVLLLISFLLIKPQVKNMNIKYYNL